MIAAFGAGALHTWQGDYLVGFMAGGVLCLLATGLVLGLSRRQWTGLSYQPSAAS